jgi:CRISPR-associated protein Csd2
MNTRHLDPAIRHDMVFLFDVTDGNPNGDPDAGNRPRTDDETSHGLVTDVALKRKVRDTIGMAAQASGMDPGRYQIFVEAGHALNTRLEESYTANGLEFDSTDTTPPDEDPEPARQAGRRPSIRRSRRTLSAEDAERARRWLAERYVDIRLFGAVLSTGRTGALGQIRGPLQFGMARSIDPVSPVDHGITRVTQTTQADIDAGERTEMGNKWTIPYALYKAELYYSAARGAQTGVTSDDLQLLYTTLLNMFDHDRSATRGVMAARGLYTFSHSGAFGNAPAHALVSRITAEHTGLGAPRSFGDYKITIDDHDLPAGVTLERLAG